MLASQFANIEAMTLSSDTVGVIVVRILTESTFTTVVELVVVKRDVIIMIQMESAVAGDVQR